jgi:hypothetical protein
LSPRIDSKLAFLAVSTFSLLTACGGGGAAAVMSSAEGKYVMPNSNVLAVIDLQKIASSKIFTDQIKPLIESNPELKKEMDKGIADGGIDPFKDIKSVMISGDTDSNDKIGYVLTGASTLDSAKFIAKVKEKEKDAQLEAIGANSVYGSPKAEGFAEMKKAAGVDGSPAVKALWDSVDKSGAITVVVSLTGKKLAAQAPDPTLAKATAVMVSANVTDGISAKVSIRFPSADDANALKAVADKQMQDPGFAMVSGFATVKVSVSGSDLVVDASMTADQIKSLVGMAAAFMPKAGPPPMPMPEVPAAPGAAPVPTPTNP